MHPSSMRKGQIKQPIYLELSLPGIRVTFSESCKNISEGECEELGGESILRIEQPTLAALGRLRPQSVLEDTVLGHLELTD